MSVLYNKMINIVSAYNVMNEAEQCPNKPIFDVGLMLYFLIAVSEIIINFHM